MSFNYHPSMLQLELEKIAEVLVQPGRVILDASDFVEGAPNTTDSDQGNKISEMSTEPRSMRETFFSTNLLSSYVSGVIINETMVNTLTLDGSSFINLFRKQKIIPGIKLSKNIIKLGGVINGTTTEGLDDLAERCKLYKQIGFHFAQWTSQLEISCLKPTTQSIQENANILARFVSICQAYRIVPIVYTDTIHNGMHDLTRSQKVTENFLAAIFKAFNDHHVLLKGLILKCNVLTQGTLCENKCSTDDIAYATITAFRRTIPVSIAGIIFPLQNYYWKDNAIFSITEIIKYINEKYNNLYTITLSTDKLDYHSRKKTITEENTQNIQEELMNEMYAISKASLGLYIG